MGAIKNKILRKLSRKFEHAIYKNASHIVALSPGMKDGVLNQGVKDEKVTTVSNMAKIDKFWPRKPKIQFLKELNLKPNTFKVIYFGAMGQANAIDYILDATEILRDNNTIDFIFIGYGKMIDEIIARKEKYKLTNVYFLGSFNMEKTSELVNLCDVSLVTFNDIPILSTNSPNKLFDSLSAGIPIIVNNPGWTKDLVEENNCGVYADCKSPTDLAKKVLYLQEHPRILKIMGENSRKLAEEKYDKSILCKKFADTISSLSL